MFSLVCSVVSHSCSYQMATLGEALDALMQLLPIAPASGYTADTIAQIGPLAGALAQQTAIPNAAAVPNIRQILPALLSLAADSASWNEQQIHQDLLSVIAALSPANWQEVIPTVFGRFFAQLANCQQPTQLTGAIAVSSLIRNLCVSPTGCDMVAGQSGVYAVLAMLNSQPSCCEVIVASCETCRSIAVQSALVQLPAINGTMRTIVAKALSGLNCAGEHDATAGAASPLHATMHAVAWDAACRSLVALIRHICSSTIQFPLLLDDVSQATRFMNDIHRAPAEPITGEVTAILFLLRCLVIVLADKANWSSTRHIHALQLLCSLAQLPRYQPLLLSANALGQLVSHLQLHGACKDSLGERAQQLLHLLGCSLNGMEMLQMLQLVNFEQPELKSVNERYWMLATALLRLEATPGPSASTVQS